MSRRSERACAQLPSWMLRAILRLPARRDWWLSAYVELWSRVVEDAVDEQYEPWSATPRARH